MCLGVCDYEKCDYNFILFTINFDILTHFSYVRVVSLVLRFSEYDIDDHSSEGVSRSINLITTPPLYSLWFKAKLLLIYHHVSNLSIASVEPSVGFLNRGKFNSV